LYTEKTLRVPSYWCYAPPADAPEVSPPPMEANGFVTFGCFNKFAKVTPAALEVWRSIMAEVPGSRLLVSCDSDVGFERMRSAFAPEISPDRQEQVRYAGGAAYFELYRRIDIALDPFPFAGGTTSCDALYMGVPVVTLAGRNGVSRGGVSVLSQVGLVELIANSPEEYMQIAGELARDRERLSELRATLRERMRASRLMDAVACARGLEQAFCAAWTHWCDAGSC
jgi:predicted O-linked N-acetylglucosamine transferase (SPINDLY family)